MRRVDQLVGEIAGLASEMREERRLAEKTYVRQDLWLAQVKADQMMVANIAGDVRGLETRQDATEAKRRQNFQFSVGLAVSVFALLLTLIGFIVNRSAG